MRISISGAAVILTDGFSTKYTPNVDNASLRGQTRFELLVARGMFAAICGQLFPCQFLADFA